MGRILRREVSGLLVRITVMAVRGRLAVTILYLPTNRDQTIRTIPTGSDDSSDFDNFDNFLLFNFLFFTF